MMSPESSPSVPVTPPSPFLPGNNAAYAAWRRQKLDAFPHAIEEVMVEIEDALNVSDAEAGAVHTALEKTNFAIYRLGNNADPGDKTLVRQLGRRFGLENLDGNLCADEDGITSLQVVEKRDEGEYIPYTNKRLNWHTDGYYNSPDRQIRAIVMHCVRPAVEGGENSLLDHEIAYILLRDENPEFITALMQDAAMTIPANVQEGVEIRPQQTGPVFSVDPSGRLHMRYSARARNIVWKQDLTTQRAAEFLLALFRGDSPYIFRHRLQSGEGVISNNVLHCRTPFENDADQGQNRLLFRARYFDRIRDKRVC